jgi:RHS repeat-associated protein
MELAKQEFKSWHRARRCCAGRRTAKTTRNGNLTQKQNSADAADNTLYTWDADNRLSSITKQGQGASQTATVQYLYEGAQALGEIRDGKLSHRLLAGLGLDETIARIAISASGAKDPAASRIFLTDALNSVIAQMSDADEPTLQTSCGYSPYGQSATVGTDSTNNPIQYTSRENDGTGLFYYRARYYDPVLKRFVSEDPIGLAGGGNFFAYVNGNPVSLVDPDGQLPIFVAWMAIGGLAGGITNAFDAFMSGKCGIEVLRAFGIGGAAGMAGALAGAMVVNPLFAGAVSSAVSNGLQQSLPHVWSVGDSFNGLHFVAATVGGAVGGIAGRLIDVGKTSIDLTSKIGGNGSLEGNCGCK